MVLDPFFRSLVLCMDCEHGRVIHAQELGRFRARIPEAPSQKLDDRVTRKHDARGPRGAERRAKEHAVLAREPSYIVEYFQFLEIVSDGVDVGFGSESGIVSASAKRTCREKVGAA